MNVMKEKSVLTTDVTDHRKKMGVSGRWRDETLDCCFFDSGGK